MKKIIIIITFFLIITSIVFSGCFESPDEPDKKKGINTNLDDNDREIRKVNLTMYEYFEDQKFDTDLYTYFHLYQKSLIDGDTLFMQSNISTIEYDPASDQTNISFSEYKWISGTSHGFSARYRFEGDITDNFKKDDKVVITVTIKRVVFSGNGFDFDMEIFKEQWVNENYFNTRFSNIIDYQKGFKLLPASVIEKVE